MGHLESTDCQYLLLSYAVPDLCTSIPPCPGPNSLWLFGPNTQHDAIHVVIERAAIPFVGASQAAVVIHRCRVLPRPSSSGEAPLSVTPLQFQHRHRQACTDVSPLTPQHAVALPSAAVQHACCVSVYRAMGIPHAWHHG
jgi:hypothetical protein